VGVKGINPTTETPKVKEVKRGTRRLKEVEERG
jgi:hypothetical protein